ncbi:MAG: serine hydrolase, partial [Actinomycetota bacterium]|nr:serine hydrolase [Actinomycetota bacterium]
GSANGQFAELLTVPERGFAVVALSNAGPNGIAFNQAVARWALETYLGVVDRDPDPLPFDGTRVGELVGTYQIDAMNLTIRTDGARLTLEVGIKPEIRAAADTELPPDYAPAGIGLLPGEADEYIVTSGGLKGQRGYFTRDASGAVVGVDLAGRIFSRVATAGG